MAKKLKKAAAGYLNQYQNISEAYAYSTSPHREENDYQDRHSMSRRKIKIRKRVKKKPVYVLTDDKKRKISGLTMVTLALVFMGILGVTLSFAIANNKRGNVVKLQNELRTLQESNMALELEAAESLNLNEVEKIAVNKLGMRKPKPYQIIEINVPKQSYIVRNEAAEDKNSNWTLKDIFNFVKIKGEGFGR